ncbi:hypothetical protein BCV69DRAFT_276765 [Microstroma glucosiphilum]|uniref:Uncharacterized protein n=1 Tax=Pseudomicrostroma glucosiphilum TaxID=1684307 RepID=A0A316UDU2_9BASI|nr:hypothetical protein BCV69DRAFT_276765 [Pseudomicrostroma glucosiphilum]PWN21245.1 hypothetical protein BCV69DRAFT_276765 [Pseudomicrostroma glucosiphilum]
MVLQNKYKARASRRYQAQRGGGSAPQGTRGRGGRSAGPSHQAAHPDAADYEEHTSGDEASDDEDDEGGVGHVSVLYGAQGETGSPKSGALSSIAGAGEPKQPRGAEGSQRSKYAKRKLESNAWRFERSDGEEGAEDASPEPEVDLTAVFEKARIAHQAGKDGSETLGTNSTDDLEDVDHSLAYLHERASTRTRGTSSRVSLPSSSSKSRMEHISSSREGYEEAQRANRQAKERSDAKMKIWGKLQDDLKANTRNDRGGGTDGRSVGAPGAVQARSNDKANIKALDGEDFLDSVLS